MLDALIAFLHAVYDVIRDSAPAILLGTICAGLLRSLFAGRDLPAWVTRRSAGSVIKAVLVGVPLPLCSCAVLPVAMDMRRRGASRGATSAFLIATPQTGVDSILLSTVLLNPLFAAARVVGAFLTGTLAGILQNLGDHSGASASAEPAAKSTCGSTGCGCHHEESASHDHAKPKGPLERLRDGQRYAFGDLLPSMTGYYAIGFLATGLLLVLLPEDALAGIAGGGLLGMLAACAIGVAMYICASSATPLAAVLVAKGMSPGTALVLLLAGPATSLASMIAVRAMLGTRGLAIYLASIVAAALALGLGLDALWATLGGPAIAMVAGEEHLHGNAWMHAAAIGLMAIFAGEAIRRLAGRGTAHAHA